MAEVMEQTTVEPLSASEKKRLMRVFETAIMGMLREYPFHFGLMGGVHRHVERLFDKGLNPTGHFAATWFEGTQLHMEITRMFEECSPGEQTATLIHELEHVLRRHLMRLEDRDVQLWGYATDVAINQDVKGLPKGVLTVERFNEPWRDKDGNLQPGVDLPLGLTSEEYYERLKQFAEENEDKFTQGGEGLSMPGQQKGCSPDSWEDLSEWEKQQAEEGVKNLVRNSASWLKRSGAGLGSYAGVIEEWLTVPNPWKAYINRFVASTRKPESRRTWRRVNRHNEFWKGARYESSPVLLLVLDTSGSISDMELSEFMAHMEHLRKMGVELWVMQCDWGIQSVEKWVGGDVFMVKGRGGTSFLPPFEWVENYDMAPHVVGRPKKFDGVIYLTDGWGDAPEKLTIPTLWGITRTGKLPREGLWGFTLPE